MATLFEPGRDDERRVGPDETQPLLPDRRRSDEDARVTEQNHPLYWRTFIGIVVLICLVGTPISLISTILTKVFELLYCDDYYRTHDPSQILSDGSIPEHLCKISPISARVSTLNGNRDFFTNLPSFISTIAIGLLADRVGRKPLITLNIILFALRAAWILFVCLNYATMDLRFIYLESVFVLAGGGLMVLQSLVFISMTDVTAHTNRTVTFFRIYAIDQVSTIVTPFLAAGLMKVGALFALKLAVGMQIAGILTIFAMPETVHALPKAAATPENEDAQHTSLLRRGIRILDQTFGFLFRDWRLLAGAGIYMVAILRNPLERLQLLYISTRQSVTISDAALIDGAFRVLATTVLLFFIPLLIRHLTRRARAPWSAHETDVLVVRTGLFALAAGWLVMGLASNFPLLGLSGVILACSAGMPAALRTCITSWVAPAQIGLLNGVIGFVDVAGLTAGGPVIAQIFNWGVGTEDPKWFGLPYLCAAGLMGFVAVAVLLAPWHGKEGEEAEEE